MALRFFLILSLLVAGGLRLVWPGDIEYKYDESHVFGLTQAGGGTNGLEAFPSLGMVSGVSLRNPGMSVWVFIAGAKVLGIHSPVGLARFVQVLSVLALLVWLCFARFSVRDQSIRNLFYWMIAFVAVSPFHVLYERKIWAQSVLPVFVAFFIWAWWCRKNTIAAFFWGFIGAILGQIHMSGFFFAFAIWVWTVVFLRRSIETRSWKFWFLGSVLGVVPMVPWIVELLRNSGESHYHFHQLVEFRFWRFWISSTLGVQWKTLLGDMGNGMGIRILETLSVISVFALVVIKIRTRHMKSALQGDAWHLVFAGLVGYGTILTLSSVQIHRHYLIIVGPLFWIALAGLAKKRNEDFFEGLGSRLLLAIWSIQLLMTASLLHVIHQNRGAPEADYGRTYSP